MVNMNLLTGTVIFVIMVPWQSACGATPHQTLANQIQYTYACTIDYWPCNCSNDTYGLQVDCPVSSTQDYLQIKAAFSRSEVLDHYAVYFRALSPGIAIPSNVLGGKRSEYVHLLCPNSSVPLGSVESDAFAFSSPKTDVLIIKNCDLNGVSFGFLQQLTSLDKLYIGSSSLYTLQSMPVMPSLRSVDINNCTGFRQWYPPSKTPNLTSISITYNEDIDDERIDYIMASFAYFYHGKLTDLYLDGNALTHVPALVSTFSNLAYLSFHANPIKTLRSGSIDVTSKMRGLYLSQMQLETIEPRALLGDFSRAKVWLNDNNLTSFTSGFKTMLQSMFYRNSADVGNIDVRGNCIKYDCGLSWLLSDNRKLLPFVKGHLANGTEFGALSYSDLTWC